MTDDQKAQLAAYAQLVRRYGQTLDLSSGAMLERFEEAIGDCAVFEPHLPQGARLLDVGAGVGLPGIPLAILRPDVQVTLCEIRQRRAAFLMRAVGVLGLPNASVYDADVRKTEGSFDAVTAQAFGRLDGLYRMVSHVLAPKWRILTTKGQGLSQELEDLAKIVAVKTETRLLASGLYLVIAEGAA